MTRQQNLKQRKKMNSMHKEEEQVLRFSRLNRGLHIVMIVSFISLSLTGMTLKFSYTSWAVLLSHFFGGFEAAGAIHRFAASTMVIVFITHIVDITRIKRKEAGSWKAMIFGKDSMMFNKKDLEDIPKYVLKDLRFVFVDHLDQALKVALARPIKTEEEVETRSMPRHLTAQLHS